VADWRHYLLRDLTAPESAENLEVLREWAASEGMSPSYHNPLATTLALAGSRSINSVGVQAYSSDAVGAEALAQTLRGRREYAGIIHGLRSNLGLPYLWAAINRTEWCRGCQGGRYPVALYEAIHLRGGVVAGTVPAAPPSPGAITGSVSAPGAAGTSASRHTWHEKVKRTGAKSGAHGSTLQRVNVGLSAIVARLPRF
jgi:hypothetical protein